MIFKSPNKHFALNNNNNKKEKKMKKRKKKLYENVPFLDNRILNYQNTDYRHKFRRCYASFYSLVLTGARIHRFIFLSLSLFLSLNNNDVVSIQRNVNKHEHECAMEWLMYNVYFLIFLFRIHKKKEE